MMRRWGLRLMALAAALLLTACAKDAKKAAPDAVEFGGTALPALHTLQAGVVGTMDVHTAENGASVTEFRYREAVTADTVNAYLERLIAEEGYAVQQPLALDGQTQTFQLGKRGEGADERLLISFYFTPGGETRIVYTAGAEAQPPA